MNEILRALETISKRDPQSDTCGPEAPDICENGCLGCIARSALGFPELELKRIGYPASEIIEPYDMGTPECSCLNGQYNQFCKRHGLNGYYRRAQPRDTVTIPMVKRATGRTIPDLTKREHVCEYQSSVKPSGV